MQKMTLVCGPGDIAPRFVLPVGGKANVYFDSCADNVVGNFIAIAFLGAPSDEASRQFNHLIDSYASFESMGVRLIAVFDQKLKENFSNTKTLEAPFNCLFDVDGDVFKRYCIYQSDDNSTSPSTLVILRPNGHILSKQRGESSVSESFAILRSGTKSLQRPNPSIHPPLLMIPDVLNDDECGKLISLYKRSNAPFVHHTEVIGSTEHDIKTIIPDYGRQDRVDHCIRDPDLQNFLIERLAQRLLPEITKAFHYQVTKLEGLRIACYGGERGGAKHGHRDNSSPPVSHRRFAMSLNLNANQFKGGQLVFSEYSRQKYKPQTGTALVFSCSMLHEALEVRDGERFVLLAFLNGEC